MPIDTVAQGFDTYRQRVIPDDAPKVQTEECRRAFYAGAYHMLMNCVIVAGDENASDEQSIAALETLQAEIETYVASLQPGYTAEPVTHALGSDAHDAAREHTDKLTRRILAPDIGYTTTDPDHVTPVLRELGAHIGNALPAGYGFTLLLFNYGPGNLFYISSAERADTITAMQEFIRKQVS